MGSKGIFLMERKRDLVFWGVLGSNFGTFKV